MNSSFIERLNNKLNMIELTSKPIIENDIAWQQHGTPDKVIDMMLDMYYENGEFNNNEKILILFNVEFIKQIYFKYKDELIFGNLYFIADTKEKFDIVRKLYPNVHCLFCNEHIIEKLIEKIGEFNVKKFDIVFSNPPYNNGLDIVILNYICKFSKNIIFLHPISWLLSNDITATKFNQYKKQKDNHFLKKLFIFKGNSILNIKLFGGLGISFFNTTQKFDNVEVIDRYYTNSIYKTDIYNISIHGTNIDMVKEFQNKLNFYIKNHGNLLTNNIKNYEDLTDFSVRFAGIRGNIKNDTLSDDFYSMICKNYNDNKCDKNYRNSVEKYNLTLWSFKSENERMNFINYCKSKFARFCLTFTKFNANLNHGQPTKQVPWLDFTQEWNDAKLCKEFEISDKLWNYINNFIPDYYDDYKSGF